VSTTHLVRTEEETVSVDVDCAYCGYAGTAVVRATGTGTATSFLIVDRNHARRAAAEEAVEDLAHHAGVTASLLPCPSCGRRSRSTVVQHVIVTAIGALFLVALAVGVWLIADPGLGRWAGAGAFALAAGVTVNRARSRLRAAESLLVSVKQRPVLPPATVVKVGPAIVPVASKAPEPQPTHDGGDPKLLR
jgi:hypothetical protein